MGADPPHSLMGTLLGLIFCFKARFGIIISGYLSMVIVSRSGLRVESMVGDPMLVGNATSRLSLRLRRLEMGCMRCV